MGYGLNLLGAPPRQVGALRKVLAQQAIGVLVRGALPRTAGCGKEDPYPGLARQPGMVGQFLAAVPSEIANADVKNSKQLRFYGDLCRLQT